MTKAKTIGYDIAKVRVMLGKRLKLGRPLYAAELGRLLGLDARDPGRTINHWETGKTEPIGLAAFAIKALLAGYQPKHIDDALTPYKKGGR